MGELMFTFSLQLTIKSMRIKIAYSVLLHWRTVCDWSTANDEQVAPYVQLNMTEAQSTLLCTHWLLSVGYGDGEDVLLRILRNVPSLDVPSANVTGVNAC